MIALLGSVLAASLLGSLHCAGMCGGLVAFVCAERRETWLVQVAYHLGRLLLYGMLGVLAAALGSTLNLAGSVVGLSEAAALAAGAVMIAWALRELTPVRRWWASRRARRQLLKPRSLPLQSFYSRALAVVSAQPPFMRGLGLGAATALLPCGWLYAFVATAAGTGSVVYGGGVMVAFWLGTVPVLLGLGAVVGRLGQAARLRLPMISASAVLLLGLATLANRYVSSSPAGAAEARPSCHTR